MSYADFLASKRVTDAPSGFDCNNVHPDLFAFQSDIVKWAIRRGRAAVFARYGLGKTLMQLAWASEVSSRVGTVLILAPLAVAHQTVREGARFGIDVQYHRSQSTDIPPITVTNYEMLEHFDTTRYSAVVLDESSILKAYSGKTKQQIVGSFRQTPYKLCCTATPAPNDFEEIGNHAEFLGVMRRVEMLSTFFYHDGGDTAKWTLKPHAEDVFFRWVSSWACAIRKPSDLGYSDAGYDIPPLQLHTHIMDSECATPGFLIEMPALSLSDQRDVKKRTVEERAEAVAELINATDESCVVWGETNAECDRVTDLIRGAVQVAGSDSIEQKESRLMGFADGVHRVIVTKPSICGFGLNWQHSATCAFISLSHSFEQQDQAIHRQHRFGQKEKVNAHFFLSKAELPILYNIERKREQAELMSQSLVDHMRESMQSNIGGLRRECTPYIPSKNMILPPFMKG